MTMQKGFFTEDLRLSELSEHGDPLQKLKTMIPWENFRHKLNRILKKEAKGPGGRPPFDYVMMLKILVLQRVYNISDSRMQYQIMDRLSFMRFLGLKEGEVPKDWSENKLRQKDVDARWATKGGQRHYGYKNHIKVDRKSKLIKNYIVTSAEVHDSQILEDHLEETDSHHELYADSAYTGTPTDKRNLV